MKPLKTKLIADIVVITIIIAGVAWILSLFIHIGKEYTNNAQVQQDIISVSCRVQGFITSVRFEEFSYVHKNDTLALIEDTELRLRLAQAEADYENALIAKAAMGTTITTTENNIAVTDAGIAEVQIQFQSAEREYKRYANLLKKGAVTQQQYDGMKTQYESLRARLETMQRQRKTTDLMKDEQTLRLSQNEAGIAVCKAALDLARLNLSYTVILAPCDGYTSRKTIYEGELVMPGQNIVSVVSDSTPWVIANYRETQMPNIAIGGKATIEVDAIPGTIFSGTVCAISDATGAEYSHISPDNSTGNFVKTAQRIPVKISFDKSNDANALRQLRSGLNAECKIAR